MVELNFYRVTIDGLISIIKTIRTQYATELSKVRQFLKNGTSTDDGHILKLFWFK